MGFQISPCGRSPMAYKKLSVIIPVYNEALYVEEVLKDLGALKLPCHLSLEVVVVDDGSTDKTREILKKLPRRETLKIHYHEGNFGKGTAIREGLKHVTGEIVII